MEMCCLIWDHIHNPFPSPNSSKKVTEVITQNDNWAAPVPQPGMSTSVVTSENIRKYSITTMITWQREWQ